MSEARSISNTIELNNKNKLLERSGIMFAVS